VALSRDDENISKALCSGPDMEYVSWAVSVSPFSFSTPQVRYIPLFQISVAVTNSVSNDPDLFVFLERYIYSQCCLPRKSLDAAL
jgi:hypothetical protein